jgi:hypothetical protein
VSMGDLIAVLGIAATMAALIGFVRLVERL